MERIYAETLRTYTGIKHNWEIPLQLTLRSGFDGGIFGPVFLLVPLALLALRFKSGRRLLLAGLVFAMPAYLNVGTRFLIPAAPFLTLALGMGLSECSRRTSRPRPLSRLSSAGRPFSPLIAIRGTGACRRSRFASPFGWTR